MDSAVLVAIVTGISASLVKPFVDFIISKLSKKKDKFQEAVDTINTKLNKLENDVKAANNGLNEVKETIQHIKEFNVEKERAYLTETYYKTKKNGFCHAELKDVYRERFMQYRDAGYNHVKQHWLEEILALPEHLEEE